MRRFTLTCLGLAIAAAYTWLLALATPDHPGATIRRAVLLAVSTAGYGWCFGKERWIPTARLVVEQLLMPLILLGTAVAGAVFGIGYLATQIRRLVSR